MCWHARTACGISKNQVKWYMKVPSAILGTHSVFRKWSFPLPLWNKDEQRSTDSNKHRHIGFLKRPLQGGCFSSSPDPENTMWVLSSSSRKILIEEHGSACMWSDSCLSVRELTHGGGGGSASRVIIWLPCEHRALLLTCEFVTTSGQLAWKAGGSSLGTPLLQKPSCRLRAWTQQLCLNTAFTRNLIVWAVKYIPTVKVGIPTVSDVLVAQLCQTLCDPMDCSLPGTSVHGILQASILEWVALPFSRGIFLTLGSNPGLPHGGWILYCLSHRGSPFPSSPEA